MTDIQPIEINLDVDAIYNALQYLDGEELDMLDDWGIHLAELGAKGMPNRLVVALGYFRLRRQHPDLSYEDGRKLVRVRLQGSNGDTVGEVQPVDPTADVVSVS